jgi:hypothetical protein
MAFFYCLFAIINNILYCVSNNVLIIFIKIYEVSVSLINTNYI